MVFWYLLYMQKKTQIQYNLSKTATLEKTKNCFSRLRLTQFKRIRQCSKDAGRTYFRMLQGEHSAILSTFIKLPFVNKVFDLSIFERPLKTDLLLTSRLD